MPAHAGASLAELDTRHVSIHSKHLQEAHQHSEHSIRLAGPIPPLPMT